MQAKILETYNFNKISGKGTLLECPSCQSKFVKVHHQQAFCRNKSGTKCKDAFWNGVNSTPISDREWTETFNGDYLI